MMQPVSLLFHDVYVSDVSESGFNSPAADRYKLSVTEFEAQLGASDEKRLRPERGAGGKRVEDAPPSESERGWGPASIDIAAARLTFDDGGVSFYTVVAEKLEARGLHAYCFVTTDYIGRPGFLDAAQIRELDARGHVMGTHSATHPARFSALDRAAMLREWKTSRQRLEDVLGHAVTTGSVPGGYFSKDVARAAAESGLFLLFNSEPVRSVHAIDGCVIAGRYTIRGGAPADYARRLVQRAPWARSKEWASWNAKGLVKPLLGSSYPRVADWIYGGAR
jgi:peptidoglycan/xylan/chitin deacetylase (PgdA/CDA1 family)